MHKVISFALLLAFAFVGATQTKSRPSRRGLGSALDADQVERFRKEALQNRFLQLDPTPLPEDPSIIPGRDVIEAHKMRAAGMAQRIARMSNPKAAAQTLALASAIESGQPMPGLMMRPYLAAGSYPSSVVTGDFDRDGHLDFIVANAASNDLWLYRGNGDDTFRIPLVLPLSKGTDPIYIAAADLRATGKLDLIVAEYGSFTVGVLLNNGDGTFQVEQDYPLPDSPGGVTIADFNHDGKLDVVAGIITTTNPSGGIPWLAMLSGNGDGTFNAPVITMNYGYYSRTSDIDSADVNGDGLPDVLITNPNQLQSTVYFNNGDGTFRLGPDLLPAGYRWGPMDGRLGDVNGDGCSDAVISELLQTVLVSYGNCAGQFSIPTAVWIPQANTALRLADVNGDGKLDIVTSSIIGQNLLFRYTAGNTITVSMGDGKGNFGSPQVYTGNSESSFLALGDFKGNGFPSVITADADSDTVSLYLNDGTGDLGFPEGSVPSQFVTTGAADFANPYTGLGFADLNRDGKPDLFRVGTYDNNLVSLVAMNDGLGRFAPDKVSPIVPVNGGNLWDFRLGDFRNTGHQDLLLLTSNNIEFQPGNGDGTFAPGRVLTNSVSNNQYISVLTTADFDGDGKLDFAIATGSNNHTLTPFWGNGDGTFRTGAALQFADSNEIITRIFSGDFNRDGRPDIIVFTTQNGYWTPNMAVWEFLGIGDGTFRPAKRLYDNFQSMAMRDLNGDGAPDIARYDFMWPDGLTPTDAPPKFTNYLAQLDGTFKLASSYAPYPTTLPVGISPYNESGDPNDGSVLADFNGDHIPDEVAFLRPPGWLNGRFLAGNGDGTFLPTFDEFQFSAYYYPIWQHDLNGDGLADMVQLDGGTDTVTVYPGAPAPAFQMALESTEVSGVGCGYVWPNVISSFDRSVSLVSTVPGVILSSPLTIGAGSGSAKFCFTLDANFDPHTGFDITAALDGQSQTVYGAAAFVKGFSESLSARQTQPVYLGESSPAITVSVTAQPGYAGTVQLGCQQLLPGWSCQFAPSQLTLTPGDTATASLVVTSSTDSPSLGNPIHITSTDGTYTQSEPLQVQTIQLGIWGSGSSTIWAQSPGTTSNIGFFYNALGSHSESCSGLPAGASCNFTDVSGTNQLNMTVTLPSNVNTGLVTLQVNIASATYSASTSMTLDIFNDSLGAPASGSLQGIAGGTANLTFPFQSTNLPPALMVFLACDMDGLNCTNTPVVSVNSSTTQLPVTINIPSGLSTGTHTLSITTTVLGYPQTYQFPFNVGDFSGDLSATSLTLKPGGSSTVSLTVTPSGGLMGNVTFSCSGTSKLSCSFSPGTLQLATGGTQTVVTITAMATASTGDGPLNFEKWTTLCLLFPWMLIGFRWRRRSLHLFIVAAGAILVCSCGGGSSGGSSSGGNSNPPSTYTLQFAGQVNGVNRSFGTVTVTVNH
jgi:hypothetical protein